METLIAEQLARQALARGGFTYCPTTGAQPATGYAVGTHPERSRVVPTGDCNPYQVDELAESIVAFEQANADLFRNPRHHIGAWVDNSALCLDISIVVPTLDDALHTAIFQQQEAVYNLATDLTVYVDEYTVNGAWVVYQTTHLADNRAGSFYLATFSTRSDAFQYIDQYASQLSIPATTLRAYFYPSLEEVA